MYTISKKHIIITGSNGYIGKAVKNFFLQQNSFEISILSSSLKETKNLNVSSYNWKLGDPFPSMIIQL